MSGFLKTWQWTWARPPEREPSESDRNWHQSEAARYLKAENLPDAERHLVLAVREADQVRASVPEKARRKGSRSAWNWPPSSAP